MFKGFKVDLYLKEDAIFEKFYRIGIESYEQYKSEIKKTLDSFLFHDGSLNGSKIQENWFPDLNFDLFISHSHKNQKLAIYLAGWLESRFNIKSFVDSCIWGNSEDLLQTINDNYSWSSPLKETYSYNQVNFASSHVHMMLSTALSMMMDKTECLFFLRTPQSVKPYKDLDLTDSPWIYAEIAISKTLRENIPDRLKKLPLTESRKIFASADQEKKLKINYNLDLSHLVFLNYETIFNKWAKGKYNNKFEALNALYEL
ncbi:hypothetical protein [Adhaeribacter soli]|uniref:Toll/interleukin-1 receptor domain-containing protein n=1 Tax=Adhaeribacter soli TaxID=2607655 RepID=A0A5N1J458_9BACT|nr:hypothetical protein [Adhaeribacter soli]KAA9345691.1 hypothetical protein F0P94_00980 [Adhaeribacter soli]